MAKKSLKCTKCDRTFSMPAHLARHTNAMHRRKAGRKKVVKRRVGRPKGSGKKKVGRPRGPAGARTAARDGAARVVATMRSYRDELLVRRTALDREIASIASAMGTLGGRAGKAAPKKGRKPKRGRPARGRGRPKGRPAGRARAGSLTDFVIKVLKKATKPIGPGEISDRAVKSGYESQAKDLAKAVSNTLMKLKQVKRVGRGMYKL